MPGGMPTWTGIAPMCFRGEGGNHFSLGMNSLINYFIPSEMSLNDAKSLDSLPFNQ